MRRIALLTLLAGFLAPVLASAPARAQATRTWVSGVGDDMSPSCSRTAPCKTFAAAISLTDTNGEIDVLDTSTTSGKLFIRNSVIRNNAGVGIAVGPSGGTIMASVENTHSINNLYGLASTNGNQIKITRSVFSGNSIAGIEADVGAQIGVEHCTVNFNGTGLQAYGTIWIDDTEISFNQAATAGTPVSFGNNRFYANVTPPGALSSGPASTDRGQN
jgi:hypothetical protein